MKPGAPAVERSANFDHDTRTDGADTEGFEEAGNADVVRTLPGSNYNSLTNSKDSTGMMVL